MPVREENSYKNILRGTSLFGGVQVFQILISLLRGKFVAIFLGIAGMGVSALFASAFDTLVRFASLGLNVAFVKRVAENRDNPDALGTSLRVSLFLTRLTALLGAVVTLVLAPWLSEFTFGSSDYSSQFFLLAVAVFFTISGAGKLSILQGMHLVKVIARASLVGPMAGLLAGVPLYYFFGTLGIVPAMVVLAFATWAFNTYMLHKELAIPSGRPDWRSQRGEISHLLKLGIILVASSLINAACIYLVNIFVRQGGRLDDVGLFNAANSVTLQYSGVVFTAMMLDYLPRLAAAISRPDEMRTIVNRQVEIVALLVGTIIPILILAAPWVVKILLTNQFEASVSLIRWMAVGILIKAISYPLGYIAFTKNNPRVFFLLEGVGANALYIGAAIAGYYFFGLIGLGYAMVAENALCLILYLIVNHRLYSYSLSLPALKECVIALLPTILSFLSVILFPNVWGYAAACIFALAYALRSLKRIRTFLAR